MEKSISGGSKVAEVQITTLIELLMRHAVKLESIRADGDSSSQKNIQVRTLSTHCNSEEQRDRSVNSSLVLVQFLSCRFLRFSIIACVCMQC